MSLHRTQPLIDNNGFEKKWAFCHDLVSVMDGLGTEWGHSAVYSWAGVIKSLVFLIRTEAHTMKGLNTLITACISSDSLDGSIPSLLLSALDSPMGLGVNTQCRLGQPMVYLA